MNKINWGRVLLGGVVAGIVIDVIEYVFHTYIIAAQETAAMKAMGAQLMNGAIPVFLALGIVTGIAAIWLYAAARPRYGASAKTAVVTGFGVWVIGYVIPNLGTSFQGLYPLRVAEIVSAVGLVEIIVASIIGASLYKE